MRKRHVFKRILAGAAGAGILAGALAVAVAPSATANIYGFTANVSSGTVGVPIALNAYSSSGLLGAAVTLQANGTTLATLPVGANGAVSYAWNPQSAGSYTLTASDGQTTQSIFLNVAPTNTVTKVTSPNIIPVGSPTNFVAYVTSTSPSSYMPVGTVTYALTNGTVLGTVPVSPTSVTAQAVATLPWTPPTTGNYSVIATFNPSNNSTLTSTSVPDNVFASPTGSIVALNHPPTFYAGVPAQLTAVTSPANATGNVVFTVNGAPMGNATPIVNGTASVAWTPPAVGNYTIGVTFGGSNGFPNGSTSEVVSVGAPTQTDNITLVPVSATGGASTAAWSAGAMQTMLNGQSINFRVVTLSGANVTLSEAGPCSFNSNLTLTATTGTGTCVLTAVSPGGNTYAGVTQTFAVTLLPGQQLARVNPPKSGTINRGAKFRIAAADAVTNIGEPISWRISKGSKACRVTVDTRNRVILEARAKGSCTLVGTAPGEAYEWNPYRITRNYKVR